MMIDPLNYILDKITMYRLLLYILLILLGLEIIFGFLNILPFAPASILIASIWLLTVCFISNKVFSYVWKVPTNIESPLITALILALIITPVRNFDDLVFMGWAGTLAMASKYILAINKKHIFNPAAIAVAITAFTINQTASWWIGTGTMMPFVLVCGLLLVKKIQRFDLLISFLFSCVPITLFFAFMRGINPISTINTLFVSSSLLFFAFVMLTEPLTTPPTRRLRIIYGILVGFLFVPDLHIGNFYSTPEIALVMGNIFSYLISPKHKLVMNLKEKIQIAPDIIDFVFALPSANIKFTPGQYMEWTLPHKWPDSRGNRRYFTIASSPTENNLRLGIKFYENGSSFKKALQKLDSSGKIVGGQLAGDFTLPKDPSKKYIFIAGGIGITPFRSMIKYMLDTNTKLNITLLFSNKLFEDIVYKEILEEAENRLGIKTIYTLTDEEKIPKNWQGEKGRVNSEMLKRIDGWEKAYYYLSGPHAMVSGFEKTLHDSGISRNQIKKDFFPGFV